MHSFHLLCSLCDSTDRSVQASESNACSWAPVFKISYRKHTYMYKIQALLDRLDINPFMNSLMNSPGKRIYVCDRSALIQRNKRSCRQIVWLINSGDEALYVSETGPCMSAGWWICRSFKAGERSEVIQQDQRTVSSTAQFTWGMLGEAPYRQSVTHCKVVRGVASRHKLRDSSNIIFSHTVHSHLRVMHFVQFPRWNYSCWCRNCIITISHSRDIRVDKHTHTHNNNNNNNRWTNVRVCHKWTLPPDRAGAP